MGNNTTKHSQPVRIPISQADNPIIATDRRYVLSDPVTLLIQTGYDRHLYVSDVATSGQYFKCVSRMAHSSCFRFLYDASETCVLSSQPQDTNGKTYKFFTAGDSSAPCVAEASTGKLLFDHILFKCDGKATFGNVLLVLHGDWRKKKGTIYLIPKNREHLPVTEDTLNQSIPIALIHPSTEILVKSRHYLVDISPGVDIALITALCMTVDGRLNATMADNNPALRTKGHP